ncbi:MAG: HAMP domain-containing sensor histidine kinase [Thermoanaerobaculia bacterium]
MISDADNPQSERGDTDESLRQERASADEAMRKKRAGADAVADETLERAREQADAVMESARDKADLATMGTDSGARGQVAIDRERVREDEVLQDERAAADKVVRRERSDLERTLGRLLPLERQRTDLDLLSERARSDEQLAHRDDFLGRVSHDLRNLLGGVVLDAVMLGKLAPDTEDGRLTLTIVARMKRHTARMSGLLGDLVDVVSIDAGKLSIRPRKCDAAGLLGEVADLFAGRAIEQGVVLQAESGEGALVGEFDPDRMLQVLANIVANALKFTSPGGRIVMHAAKVEGELRFSVADTGLGIRHDLLEAIFERFWQVGTNDQRGLGLGLYISKCIVEAHGGRIWAESRFGEGSTFHLSLPPT